MPSIKHQAYVDGYQSAMQDIQRCLREGGWEAVGQWMKDNTLAPKVQKLKWHNDNGVWVSKSPTGEVHLAHRAVDPEFPSVVDWVWKIDGEFNNAYKTLADVRYYAERYSRGKQMGIAANDPRTDPTTNPL